MLKKLLNKLRNLASGKKDSESGFTLIEVVIVLAIAGLIFVIVFLAVSQAQAGRRDTQRKSDVDRFRAAINSYASNKQGQIPTSQANVDAVVNNYLTTYTDPGGSTYAVTWQTTAPSAVANISYRNGNICNATLDGMTTTGAGTRDFAVLGYLERGGVFCVDSR